VITASKADASLELIDLRSSPPICADFSFLINQIQQPEISKSQYYKVNKKAKVQARAALDFLQPT
jgi:hypothetical protein